MMDQVIKSQCPSCRNALNVPAAYLGKTVRCKHCGHMFEIRAANNFPTGNTGTLPAPQVTPLPEVQP
ncbi:MAG: zinc-ribbon domain-containing protein, partial [Gemmataceae bacterium]|nr:zinc-ribbon domain-containing protein [Gemmataceae bacterium]